MISSYVLALRLISLVSKTALPPSTPVLTVQVRTPHVVYDVKDFWAEATILNAGSVDVLINPFGTVLDSIPSDDFQVNGTEASGQDDEPLFVGAVSKTLSDHQLLTTSMGLLVYLKPGQSQVVNTSLEHRYDFTKSGVGYYTISISPTFKVLTQPAQQSFQSISAITIPSRLKLAVPTTTTTSVKDSKSNKSLAKAKSKSKSQQQKLIKSSGGNILTSGCNLNQQNVLKLAHQNAKLGTQMVISHLKTSRMDSTFQTWFGISKDVTRLKLLLEHFEKMNRLQQSSPIIYDCNCDHSGIFSYVFPTDPTRIHVCDMFWTLKSCGMDSQQGTLIHEMSHFNVVAKTNDFVYGNINAKVMAESDPSRAMENADNHEYYEESVFASCSPTLTPR